MNVLPINPNPLMTKYLVEAKVFSSDPVVVLDIGARDGFNSEWKVFGDQIRVYCFESDETECARLTAQAPSYVTYIPWAIGGQTGLATLYEAKLNYSTGLYRTNMDYFGRLLNCDNGIVVDEHSVEVHTLDEALTAYRVPPISFIKLDVEGAELDILKGVAHHLETGPLVGVLSEIRFHEEINGSPIFSALDLFMRKFGFHLYNLEFYHQSRKVLPYPGIADFRLPSGERFFAYTHQGQIQDGNALYFRDLLLPQNGERADKLTSRDVLKLCAFYEIYSLNDCAAELIVSYRPRLESIVDCGRLLDLLASGVAGTEVGYQDYLRRYFE